MTSKSGCVTGQTIAYTSFNAPLSIALTPPNTTYTTTLAFTYGPDNNREKTVLTDPSGNTTTRLYGNGYEATTYNNITPATEVNYIQCGGSLVGMYVNQSNTANGGDMYYVYTDHLGSILTVTDGTNTYNQSFDAWGNYRDPVSGSYTGTPSAGNPSWLYRGFTGHEHLPEFQLINMNARLYDPFEGNFLSPDVCTQQPGNTQNYNKYAYCLNNPLKYTDANGKWIEIVIGAILGGFEGYEIGAASGAHGWAMFGDIMAGAGIGALSGGIGTAVSTAPGAIGAITASTIASTTVSSIGFDALSGGRTGFSTNFGAFSFNYDNGKFYSFNSKNSWEQNLTYAVGTAGYVSDYYNEVDEQEAINHANQMKNRIAPPNSEDLDWKPGWDDLYIGPNAGTSNPADVFKAGSIIGPEGTPISTIPKTYLGFGGLFHDEAYWNDGADGPTGLLFDTRVIGADRQLINVANSVIAGEKTGSIGWALGISGVFNVIDAWKTYTMYNYLIAPYYTH